MKRIHQMIATVFGLGYFPIASGTVGSLAGLGLCLMLYKYIVLYVFVFFILFFMGVVSSNHIENEMQVKDPSCVVIDEFACIFLVFLFVPISYSIVLVGFVLYRLIDIIKVPPMRFLEKKHGGWGIMMDDLVGGIYTNLILHVLVYSNIL
ncbi:MAG: phosphatidylglycerophosphatase A [Candidatus Omnitrophota bacterium]